MSSRVHQLTYGTLERHCAVSQRSSPHVVALSDSGRPAGFSNMKMRGHCISPYRPLTPTAARATLACSRSFLDDLLCYTRVYHSPLFDSRLFYRIASDAPLSFSFFFIIIISSVPLLIPSALCIAYLSISAGCNPSRLGSVDRSRLPSSPRATPVISPRRRFQDPLSHSQ